jgi:nitroreductase
MPATNTAGTSDLWEALSTQRAIRKWKPDAVPDELLRQVIEAGTKAPSGSNRQPWRFLVIREPARRAHIAKMLREKYEANEGMRRYFESGRKSEVRSQRLMLTGAENIATHLDAAPVFIIPCLYPGGANANGLLAGTSIYQAVQNIMLAARGLGLGTVMTTFQGLIDAELREYLGIPEDATPAALLPLGYPDANFGPVNRKPVAEVAFWEEWGTPLV